MELGDKVQPSRRKVRSSEAATRPAADQAPTAARVVGDYRVDEQIGMFIRRGHQRASAIFARHFAEAGLSPLQFTALIIVRDQGRVSQNLLGRLIHVDPATIMGVVNRLVDRNLLRRLPDPSDKRRTLLAITSDGLKLTETLEQAGHDVTTETLAPLTPEEQATLYDLLAKVI